MPDVTLVAFSASSFFILPLDFVYASLDNKYKFINSTLAWEHSQTDHAQIWSYAELINDPVCVFARNSVIL